MLDLCLAHSLVAINKNVVIDANDLEVCGEGFKIKQKWGVSGILCKRGVS